jgi:small subunit ribosomal protein S16
MSVKIRLTRLGDKGNPFYRLVVAEHSNPRDGKFIQILGTYDPNAKDKSEAIKVNREIALEWIAKGAQATDTARMVLVKAGVLADEKPKKKTSVPKPKAPKEKKKKEK